MGIGVDFHDNVAALPRETDIQDMGRVLIKSPTCPQPSFPHDRYAPHAQMVLPREIQSARECAQVMPFGPGNAL